MRWQINRCYDSHLHILGTGILFEGLNLFELNQPSDLANIKLKKNYFKGEWLVGFGWDHTKWPSKQWPTAKDLDAIFPEFPVAFARADGHTLWMNSLALKKIGYFQKTETQKATPEGGVILRDDLGYPTGIFQEHAKLMVDFLIPDYTKEQKITFLTRALDHFSENGFTHIRDMTGNIEQWNLLLELEKLGKQQLYIEQNFVCENIADLERALAEIKIAKVTSTNHLRYGGIKVFFDGSLGSEGAYLSQNYKNTNNRGLLLWTTDDMKSAIRKTWQNGFDFCVHTIGDEAAHIAVKCAFEVWHQEGIKGRIHIEHAQILRTETIAMLKQLDVVCHMQPCHYLSDRRWLKEKLGTLFSRSFPWQELELSGIKIQFGSDSPIEPASIAKNYLALQESAKDGIPQLHNNWVAYHSHPDPSFGSECVSIFEDGIFVGRK